MKSDDDIQNAFSDFGTTLEIDDNIIKQMERFICLLYHGKAYERGIKGIVSKVSFLPIFTHISTFAVTYCFRLLLNMCVTCFIIPQQKKVLRTAKLLSKFWYKNSSHIMEGVRQGC